MPVRARARTCVRAHTPRIAGDDFEITKRVVEEARDEAEESRLQNVVKSELMSPTAQQYAKWYAKTKDKNAAHHSETTDASSADESPPVKTIRERGAKVSTPKRKQRAGSDNNCKLSPHGKGWLQSPSRQHGSPARGRSRALGDGAHTKSRTSPRRASPRQAAAKEDASLTRRSLLRRLGMTAWCGSQCPLSLF